VPAEAQRTEQSPKLSQLLPHVSLAAEYSNGGDITSVQINVKKLIDAEINVTKQKINGHDLGIGSNLSWELKQLEEARKDASMPDARAFLEFI
jgi:hypothetical protein